MRSALSAMAGLALFLAACGGSSNTNGTTGSSSSGATGGTTGGTTTGSGPTGGSSTGGVVDAGLPQGADCTEDLACASQVCGVNGSGHCCAVPCNIDGGSCAATACDDTGTCVYPAPSTTPCGASCFLASSTIIDLFCDTSGDCSATTGTAVACPNNFACSGPTACNTTCATMADCATGFTCVGGACIAQNATGPCTTNNECTSLFCGINGTGDCCTNQCTATADPACTATGCDPTSGDCVYPSATCGQTSCSAGQFTTANMGMCNTQTGVCDNPTTPCPNNLGCDPTGTTCNTTCTVVTDCAPGFYCSAGACIPQSATGPCTENDSCTSGVCGTTGTGNCCTAACTSLTLPCGATDCDPSSGACNYATSTTACGSTLESCANGIQQNPSLCDGQGNCPVPGTTMCSPFICNGTAACFTTCTDATSCTTGDFCDTTNSTCCDGSALTAANPTLAVDSATGSDATACCGFGTNGPCATLTQAMKIIDAAKVANVTINATVNGVGGDWAPTGEVYPIVLGWGVELSAPGVYFTDTNSDGEIFDINNYSSSDLTGGASIVGAAKNNVFIGMDSTGAQSSAASAIQVEAGQTGNTLYIANASVNGSNFDASNAITVVGGASLTLGQDQSAAVTGTVTIGNSNNNPTTDGWNGIVCTSVAGKGCTITDATLQGGASSVVIEGQEGYDIDAEDNASISLTSAPTIGLAPSAPGFLNCPSKPDGIGNFPGYAVLLNGNVTMTFNKGMVQCISGQGFHLQAQGTNLPALTMDGTTIQNTELGLYASAGTATLTNTIIQFNYNDIEQDTDGTNIGSLDLHGGGNAVICTDSAESINAQAGGNPPGVCALDTTSSALNTSNVAWDTAGPDEFMCTDTTFASCTCEIPVCTDAPGAEGMDAVYTGSGTVTTTGNNVSGTACNYPVACTGVPGGVCNGIDSVCCNPYCPIPSCDDSVADCQTDCPIPPPPLP